MPVWGGLESDPGQMPALPLLAVAPCTASDACWAYVLTYNEGMIPRTSEDSVYIVSHHPLKPSTVLRMWQVLNTLLLVL